MKLQEPFYILKNWVCYFWNSWLNSSNTIRLRVMTYIIQAQLDRAKIHQNSNLFLISHRLKQQDKTTPPQKKCRVTWMISVVYHCDLKIHIYLNQLKPRYKAKIKIHGKSMSLLIYIDWMVPAKKDECWNSFKKSKINWKNQYLLTLKRSLLKTL